ncbi:lipid II:glycine glycyltransferase FemX [Faecalitalea cylindroides]|uniref:lipid II:glycine glycyltransferase FemX n=1 Tax=Faecalitalea cylindroides TaxID=39483 RepID=UPI00232C0CBC|nr:peptidoglycan bridge formation glycyltransferase FemA/FemB family protein [Faecalitalea cylindroides]MDB7952135.1 peptidoglycan bridge formation glycyltransferase FemA/FemB family protein [Faecalitalea cylindroides]MDB7958792.1 peptidoglycan bridge formation glycyltransferase FemA/FemB family protein [Faecalitalea cylindroides]MDB7960651.1 peptidoglycan bridge formation glycyltransferase FemA/FemB family protein [Faecalitalea cylindroides]MDB7962580.1 peptidoglycan bridge formation glycyltra
MNYRFVTSINKNEYDAFVQSSPYVNLLQSYDWALIKHNWKHIYTGVYKDEKLVGAGLVLIKELPLKMSMFYIPRGPILDFKDKELVLFYFEELKKEAKKHHCLFIKFDPMIHVNDYKSYEANDNKYKDTDLYLNIFKEIGAQHHGFTINV